MREKWKAYRLLVGKRGGTRPLERLRCRWIDNIKMDLVDMGRGGVDWIGLAQDRECGKETQGLIKCRKFIEWRHNWRWVE
jgi:hypothetical protein